MTNMPFAHRTLRPMVRCAIAAGALLVLAGCQAADGELRAVQPPPDTETAAAAAVVAPSSTARAAAPSSAERAREMAAVAPEMPKPTAAPPPSIDSDPRRLLGLDRARLTALLGKPEFRRSDAPAELWRYRAPNCMLDLFLYTGEDGAAGPLTVRHYKARTTDNGTLAAERCLEALLRARPPGKPG